MTKIGRNAPCPCGSGKKYKHCCLPKEAHHLGSEPSHSSQSSQLDVDPTPYPPPAFPESLDPRAREREERTVIQLAGREKFASDEQYQAFLDYLWASPVLPSATQPETPLERTQDTMYDAFGATGDRRVKLAHEALVISSDCADAYVLLAEETAHTPEAALPLYERGVAAAERGLGVDFRDTYAGRFWTDLDTRPYLRARYGQADVLAALGRHDEAIAVAEDLCALDPNDVQGVTTFLLNQYLIAGRDADVTDLLIENPLDPSTVWRYNTALHKFRTLGDSIFARRALLDARDTNPLVIPYILGDKKPSKRPPKEIKRLIEEYDANLYTGIMTDAWRTTPGVLDWIRRVVKEDEFLPPELVARKTGPRFYLNIYDDLDTRHCPDCGERTRKRDQNLAIMIEPAWLLVAKLPGHLCEACGLLTVDEVEIDVVADRALQQPAPDDAGNPYIVLGVIPDQAMRGREPGLVDLDWAFAHVDVFRELFEPEDTWDLDFALDQSQDLFGPVILPAPGRP